MISPRLNAITLFAWLVSAISLCLCLAAPAACDAKTALTTTLKNTKGQYVSTENNCQSLTAITHKRSWALVYTDLIGILH